MRVHLQRQATARGEKKKTGKVLCKFLSEEPSLLPNNAVRRWVLLVGEGWGVRVTWSIAIVPSFTAFLRSVAVML